MSTHKETRLVHCYDVVSFVVEIEKAVKDGFSLDLHNVQNYPQQIGFQYITTMVKGEQQEVKTVQKAQEEVVAEKTTEGTQEQPETPVEAPKKAGRPAKGK